MNVLQKVKVTSMRTFKNVGTKVSAKSPEILLGIGIVSFVGTVVMACKQTMTCEEILDRHAEKMQAIEDTKELAAADKTVLYDEKTAQKDTYIAYLQTGLALGKHYAPVIILGGVSIASFLTSYGIMRKRNMGLSLAYAACKQGFEEYRARVRKELGEEADQRFRYGYETVYRQVNGYTEDGTEVTEEKDIDTVPWDEDGLSGWLSGMREDGTFLYAPETSRHFVRTQDPRNYANDEMINTLNINSVKNDLQLRLDTWGHVTLNECLRALGMDEIPNGQINGWMTGKGDPYIDFRVKPIQRERKEYGIGNVETVFLLDFNVCGDILGAYKRIGVK